jgi:pyruvate formate lyase activating enzyme
MIDMKEAMFYEKLKGNKVRCQLCAFNCLIPEGKIGICGVRKNINGKLYSLVYDKVSSANPDPIEKKPANNFSPGTCTYSIATPGCNWKCKYCQNWVISQGQIKGESLTPEDIIRGAEMNGCQGISYTYTEPTIFYELTYDTAKLAHEKGFYNTYVTNGYMNPEPIKKISPYLDEATVDFKGSGDKEFLQKFSSVPGPEPIFKALKEYKKQNVFIEITDLIVPEIGDSMIKVKELVKWIIDNLGEETPIHFLRFFPAYKVKNLPPTPIETLEKAYQIAANLGMKYVYLGNVGEKNDTYCPECEKLLIERIGMQMVKNEILDGRCPFCGTEINIGGKNWIK